MVQTSIQEQLIRLENLRNNQTKNNPPQNNPTNPTNPVDPVDPVDPPIKTGGTFTGYATGFIQHHVEEGLGEPEFLVDGSSYVNLDADNDTVKANITATQINRLILPKTTTFSLGFGGEASNSGYIDDNTFFAIEDNGSTTVTKREDFLKFSWRKGFYIDTKVTPYLGVSHIGNFANAPTQEGAPSALCTDCEFLRYGFWSSDVTYGNKYDGMGGWWVASNDRVLSPDDMPDNGTAKYEGLAVGTFAKRQGSIWNQRLATGDMTMDWDFANRTGDLKIKKFGHTDLGFKTFKGDMYAPGYTDFAGVITGGGGIGAARGSFVGPRGPNVAPAGVMGDFGISGNNWKANGIFGGGNTRFTPGSPIAVDNH